MMNLILVKNPFDAPNSRESFQTEFVPEKTIKQYFMPYLMGMEEVKLIFACNGEVVEDENFIPPPNSYISASPFVGKDNWLGQIAMLGLAFFAPNLAAGLAGPGATAATTSLYTMGIMAIGGMLISHLFPQPGLDYDTSTSQSYGWNATETLEGQGKPLAITFGETRTGGVLIGQHTIKENGVQYLCLLFCGGQGPIEEIKDITINDNPATNYTDVTIETRLGENDQAPISFFNNIFAEQTLYYQLKKGSDWSTQQTDGDAGDGLAVTIEFPNGLCRLNDSGDPETAWVKLNIQYRKENTDGTWGSWVDYTTTETKTITTYTETGGTNENGNPIMEETSVEQNVETNEIKISASTTDAFYANFGGSGIEAGRYEVRIKMTACSPEQTSSRAVMRTYWTGLTHTMHDNLSRPGRVLVGLKIKATDQLSGSRPTIAWTQVRNYGWVYWNGVYTKFPLNNPAVACYDILHQCRRIKNIHTGEYEFVANGVSHTRIDTQKFHEFYNACESQNLKLNGIYNSASNLWDALKYAAEVGRGSILPRGTKYSCAWDAPATPVQMFSMGNIIQGTFKETFTSMEGRANAIEISITNKDKDYQKDPITILGPGWDEADNQDPVAVSMPFITDYEQGYREGCYRLNVNAYLLRTIEFEAWLESIVSERGDVIKVQHDLTEWGVGGGRLKSINNSTIVLDKHYTFSPNTSYTIMYTNSNLGYTTLTIPQFSVETTTDTIGIPNIPSANRLPAIDTSYALGISTKSAKLFRIISITRAQKLTRKITAIEYNEAVYNTSSPPTRPTTPTPTTSVPIITGVRVWTTATGTVWIDHNPSTHYNFSHYDYLVEEVTD